MRQHWCLYHLIHLALTHKQTNKHTHKHTHTHTHTHTHSLSLSLSPRHAYYIILLYKLLIAKWCMYDHRFSNIYRKTFTAEMRNGLDTMISFHTIQRCLCSAITYFPYLRITNILMRLQPSVMSYKIARKTFKSSFQIE